MEDRPVADTDPVISAVEDSVGVGIAESGAWGAGQGLSSSFRGCERAEWARERPWHGEHGHGWEGEWARGVGG